MCTGILTLRAAGLVAILVGAPALGVTAAQAHDAVKVTVTPSTIAPGGEIELKVDGCTSSSGWATSDAFVAKADLSGGEGGHSKSPIYGETTVKSSVKSGTYKINVHCGGREHSGTGSFQVVHTSGGRPDHHSGHPDHPTWAASPVAPVRAGGGGTAVLAAGDHEKAEQSGPGTPQAVIGLALAGVAALAVVIRSVRRQRLSGKDSDGHA